jgi:hypothetical protein
MSFSSTFSAADPLGEGGAMPGAQRPGTEGGGRRLLGLVVGGGENARINGDERSECGFGVVRLL